MEKEIFGKWGKQELLPAKAGCGKSYQYVFTPEQKRLMEKHGLEVELDRIRCWLCKKRLPNSWDSEGIDKHINNSRKHKKLVDEQAEYVKQREQEEEDRKRLAMYQQWIKEKDY